MDQESRLGSGPFLAKVPVVQPLVLFTVADTGQLNPAPVGTALNRPSNAPVKKRYPGD